MAPPTNDELAIRRLMIRQALARLDPQDTTPPALRDLIIEVGAHHRETGGAIIQASLAPPPPNVQPQQAQGQQGQGQHGRGRGRGTGGRGQPSGAGTGRGAGATGGRGSSGQQ
ncbi:hypothetical protein CHU98_g1333 [Xylaria longipes]|nr:hypothetical protein CHU98_g1333 [Xylaria longipes]